MQARGFLTRFSELLLQACEVAGVLGFSGGDFGESGAGAVCIGPGFGERGAELLQMAFEEDDSTRVGRR